MLLGFIGGFIRLYRDYIWVILGLFWGFIGLYRGYMGHIGESRVKCSATA